MCLLAAAWSKDDRTLGWELASSYSGLPRGRVTCPEGAFFVLNGDDSPVPGWKELVVAGFRLSGRRVKFVFDEREAMIPGHPRAVEAALGTRLSPPRPVDQSPPIHSERET